MNTRVIIRMQIRDDYSLLFLSVFSQPPLDAKVYKKERNEDKTENGDASD